MQTQNCPSLTPVTKPPNPEGFSKRILGFQGCVPQPQCDLFDRVCVPPQCPQRRGPDAPQGPQRQDLTATIVADNGCASEFIRKRIDNNTVLQVLQLRQNAYNEIDAA